jgi:hypothetical protein
MGIFQFSVVKLTISLLVSISAYFYGSSKVITIENTPYLSLGVWVLIIISLSALIYSGVISIVGLYSKIKK